MVGSAGAGEARSMTTKVSSTASAAASTARKSVGWALFGAVAQFVLAWTLSHETRRAEDIER